jgi:hypothetical protein
MSGKETFAGDPRAPVGAGGEIHYCKMIGRFLQQSPKQDRTLDMPSKGLDHGFSLARFTDTDRLFIHHGNLLRGRQLFKF